MNRFPDGIDPKLITNYASAQLARINLVLYSLGIAITVIVAASRKHINEILGLIHVCYTPNSTGLIISGDLLAMYDAFMVDAIYVT